MMTQEDLNRVPMYYLALTEEEKREAARQVLELALSSEATGIFFNPRTKQMTDVKEMTAEEGEETVLDFIQLILENSSKGAAGVKAFNAKEMKDILTGKINPNEKDKDVEQILEILKQKFQKAQSADSEVQDEIKQFIRNKETIARLVTSIVQFSQEKLSYNITNADFLSAIHFLLAVSHVNDETSELYKFRTLEPDAVFSVFSKVGEEVLAAWQEKCTEPMNKELLIMGLLSAAMELAFENEKEILPFEEIHELISEECDCENCSNESCACKTKDSDKE